MGRDPLQNIDQTVPGFLPDPSTYAGPTPGGKRRARTFSQAIADATRGLDAGMNGPGPTPADLSSSAYKPDWRGHYDPPDDKPTPRAALQLETYHNPADIHPLTLEERMRMTGEASQQTRLASDQWATKYDDSEERDERGRWTGPGSFTAYHGTLKEYVKGIEKDGIKVKPKNRNYSSEYYHGHRGESVYITNNVKDAETWAKSVSRSDAHSDESGTGATVFRVEIPHDQRSKIMTDEIATPQMELQHPTNFRFEGKIKPEWIKGVRTFDGQKWSAEHVLAKRAILSPLVIYVGVVVQKPVKKFDPSEPRNAQGEWDAAGGGVPTNVTDDEQRALESYQGNGYAPINRLLAGRPKPTDNDPIYPNYYQDKITHLDSVMARSTISHDMTLYRGMNDAAGRFGDDRFVGKDIIYPGFTSTTKSLQTAQEFAEDTGVDHTGSYIMEITAPKGTHAVNMDHTMPYGGRISESEFLLDRGTKLHIDSIDRPGRTIYATVVPK